MKKILLILVTVFTSVVFFGQAPTPTIVETKIQVEAPAAGGAVDTRGKAVAQQFKDGLLYYNAMPSTPARGTAVKNKVDT